jgi:O-antigen/teichoic acid export membrane protein
MRELVQRISTTAKSDRAVTWLKLISVTGGAQLIIQGIGLISGILIIRLLSTQEYGLYTLANTLLGTMVVLADGGISAGVMSQGGKVWKDKQKLGIVLATGLHLRRKFAKGSLAIAVPLLVYLLRMHGASWYTSLLIVACLVPAFFTALSGTLLQIAPKLNQDIVPLQKNGIIATSARLVAILSLFVFPWAFIAMLAYGLPQIWANLNLRKISSAYADWSQQPDPIVKKEIISFVKRILPGAIYFCFYGQISIWLISIFGSISSVAQVGALSRLAMVLNLFTVLFTTLVSPRFARLPINKNMLLSRFLQIQFSLLVLSFAIISVVYLFPSEVLWILGKDYSNLKQELVLNVIGSCLSLIAGIAFNLFTSRGWAINPIISIPISVLSIVAGVMFMDVSSLKGVLLLNIFVASVQVLMNGLYCLIKIMRIDKGI